GHRGDARRTQREGNQECPDETAEQRRVHGLAFRKVIRHQARDGGLPAQGFATKAPESPTDALSHAKLATASRLPKILMTCSAPPFARVLLVVLAAALPCQVRSSASSASSAASTSIGSLSDSLKTSSGSST